MAELSEREIILVHGMNMLMNPVFKDVPPDTKKVILTSTLAVRGVKFDESMVIDVMNAVYAENITAFQSALKFVDRHKISLQGAKDLLKF